MVSVRFGSDAAEVVGTTTAVETLSTLQGAPCSTREVHLALGVLSARKVNKHLLEWRLTNRIIVDVVFLLGALHRAENARPRQLLARYLLDN